MIMPIEKFDELLADTGLLSADDLRAFRDQLPADKQKLSGDELAHELIAAEKLTNYQWEQIQAERTDALVLGEYEVLEPLGAGGMGEVYRARHRRMKRSVALKVLPVSMVDSPQAIARFQREMETLARLEHPNIVIAHDAGENRGIHFLVMQLIEGEDLGSLVHRQGPLPIMQAVEYVAQVARGLEFAHGVGVVHRDLKPSNLIVDRQGTVKVLDLGLARLADSPDDDMETADALTGSGQIMGTVDYMAPEQAENTHNADHRSDIYSLGCTFYRLATGKVMYKGESVVEKLIAHREKPVRSLRSVRSDVSMKLDAIFQKMVQKKAHNRYQSMTEIVKELELYLATEPVPAGPILGGALPGDVTIGVPQAGLEGLMTPGEYSPEKTAAEMETLAESDERRRSEETINHWVKEEKDSKFRPGSTPERPHRHSKKRRSRKILPMLVAGVSLMVVMLAGVFLFNWVQGLFVTEAPPSHFSVASEYTCEGEVNVVRFSPQQRDLLVSGGQKLGFWNTKTFSATKMTFVTEAAVVTSIAFSQGTSSKSRSVAVVAGGKLQFWYPSGAEQSLPVHYEQQIQQVAYSPDDRFLAVAGASLALLHIENHVVDSKSLPNVELQSRPTRCLAFSPDGTMLASGDEQSLRLWDLETNRMLHQQEQQGGVQSIAFAPNGNHLASVGDDHQITLWNKALEPVRKFAGHKEAVTSFVFSPDSRFLVSASLDGKLRLWNVASGELLEVRSARQKSPTGLSISPDGKLLAMGSKQGVVTYWELSLPEE